MTRPASRWTLISNTRFVRDPGARADHSSASPARARSSVTAVMISFASFPSTSHDLSDYRTTRHHPDVEDDLAMEVDLEDEDFEDGAQKLIIPGEPLTSSQAFMRYVPVCLGHEHG